MDACRLLLSYEFNRRDPQLSPEDGKGEKEEINRRGSDCDGVVGARVVRPQ